MYFEIKMEGAGIGTAIYCFGKTLKTFYSWTKKKRTYKYKTTVKIKSTKFG